MTSLQEQQAKKDALTEISESIRVHNCIGLAGSYRFCYVLSKDCEYARKEDCPIYQRYAGLIKEQNAMSRV